MDNSSTPSIFNKEIEYKTFRVDKLINNPFWNSSNSFVKSTDSKDRIRGKSDYCYFDDISYFNVLNKHRSVGATTLFSKPKRII